MTTSLTRVVLLIILCGLFSGHRPTNQKDTFSEEEFSFPVIQGELILKGTLTIPKKFSKEGKLVILVAPPMPISRDYSGLFRALAGKLSRQGIAVLRYDNRSYLDSSWAEKEKATMFSQAGDASSALAALKKDKRFAQNKIGFVGHSEGGAAVAIAASQQTPVSFIVVMSSMGIKGLELAHRQMTRKVEKTFLAMTDEELFKYSEDLYKYLKILAQNEEIDSIKQKIDEHVREQFSQDPKQFGTMSLEASIKAFQNLYLKPRLISYIQFEPEKYYSQIACPAFIICGSSDAQVDCATNLKGIERIFNETNKKNYKLEIINRMDHSLRDSSSSNRDALNFNEDSTFDTLCSKIANWIKDV